MKYWVIMIILFPASLAAQKVTVKGVIRDFDNEALPLAHILLLPDSVTSVSDNRGRFAMPIRPGKKQIVVSYTGYETLVKTVLVSKNAILNFVLQPKVDQLEEVVITFKHQPQIELFESARSSTNLLSPKDVSAIPVLGGEADLIKVLQLLPGTVKGVEGSSDLFVRGGAADQNLVLFDGTTVYNTSHLLGFVSVFNPDILETVESINGAFPANTGGRLSSILNVNTNSEIADETYVSGNIGLIASRLYVEQPIVKDKVSIWAAGRRTYIDQVAKLVGQDLPYFFYDANAKLLINPTERDQLSITYYNGQDILNIFRDSNNDGDGFLTAFQSGNNSQTVNWSRKLSSKWSGSFTALHTAYQYDVKNEFRDNRILASSDIRDIGAKMLLSNNQLKNKALVKLGIDWTHHRVSPSILSTSGIVSELVSSSSTVGRVANEAALFASYERPINDRWLINTGLRTSMAFVKGRTYIFPEPRVAARYKLSDTQAIKLSYSRMAQYMNRISSSAITSPTDIWYPVTDVIRPQTSHQFSASWQRNFPEQSIFLSIEPYYKAMNNLIGLEEGTDLFFDTDFEPKLLQGQGSAYGIEFLMRRDVGKLSGWISYSLAWSRRQFDNINDGLWFPARYDRRHNGAFVAQYAIHQRWSFSVVWEFISGSRFTPIIGQYGALSPSTTGVDLIPVFAPVNSVRLAAAHRLDLGLKFKGQQDRKFQYEWFIGVYNTYNRANPFGITIETSEDGSLRYEQPGIFGLLPFISYGFHF